jgi:predicted AAA+ superfamily ATPase
MERYLAEYIQEDLGKKIVLITGPRQTGKTTLSKGLSDDFDYFNFDSLDDRLSLQNKSWDRSKRLVIFDELHKLKNWKSWLKGVYDTEGMPPALLVTGSAKLDTYRKVGDPLAGRFFQFRLHPLDLKEIHFREDCHGETRKLYYLKTKEGKEVNFGITTDGIPSLMIEVKWKSDNLSPNFEIFRKYFPSIKMVQLSKELKREKTFPNGAEVRTAHHWLSEFSLP